MNPEQGWYAYIGHDYEGPMSREELSDRIRAGELTGVHYVWSPGMKDWAMATALAEFEKDLQDSPAQGYADAREVYGIELPELPPAPVMPAPSSEGSEAAFAEVPVPSDEVSQATPSSRLWPVLEMAHPSATSAWGLPAVSAATDTLESTPAPQRKRAFKVRETAAWVLACVALAGSGLYYAYKSGAQNDIAANLDVSRDESAELKNVAAKSLKKFGPLVALGMSVSDPLTPVFHLATNLPSGARFIVTIESVDGTIPDKKPVSVRTIVTTQAGVGKTGQFRQSDGKPFPIGEYQVFVTDAPTMPEEVLRLLAGQPDLRPQDAPEKLPSPVRVLARKKVFLGGERNTAYEGKITEFNARLREQAQLELMELRQYAETLESQLSNTTDLFQLAARANQSASKWRGMRPRWLALHHKLQADLAMVSNPSFESEYFYAELYRSISDTVAAVASLNQEQHQFLNSKKRSTDDEARISSDAALAQSRVLHIKTKLAQAASLPPGPTGAPQRKGL